MATSAEIALGTRQLAGRSVMRLTVRGRRVLLGGFAVFLSRGCVLLGLFVLTLLVMMGCLMVMVRRGMMVRRRLLVVLDRRMSR